VCSTTFQDIVCRIHGPLVRKKSKEKERKTRGKGRSSKVLIVEMEGRKITGEDINEEESTSRDKAIMKCPSQFREGAV
jgi:hypothetical protein